MLAGAGSGIGYVFFIGDATFLMLFKSEIGW